MDFESTSNFENTFSFTQKFFDPITTPSENETSRFLDIIDSDENSEEEVVEPVKQAPVASPKESMVEESK